ncbi:MAG: hypothetical protein WCA07_01535 [Gloeobacterales cyanobacterium]
MNWKNSRIAATIICIFLITGAGVFSQMAGAQAQPSFSPKIPRGCTALKEVSTGSTVIRKQVRMGDQNVDFAVPPGRRFKSYRAEMRPENDANYSVEINLKYSDNTSAKVYTRNISMTRMKQYKLAFKTPIAKQPYQVNLNVSSKRNNAYSVAVQACR